MHQSQTPADDSADRQDFRITLFRGVLVFRWVWLGWLVVLAATGSDSLRRPWLAWTTVALVVGWTLVLTRMRPRWDGTVLGVDLAISMWLILVSGLVMRSGDVISGHPFFATGYPLSAALQWGIGRGIPGGVTAGLAMGAAQLASRPLNGVAVSSLTTSQMQGLIGAVVNYLVAGSAVGLVAKLLDRSHAQVREANEALIAERERAARLSERESLARQIHDSVLQGLAYIHKRGRELATSQDAGKEVLQLAEIAAQQENELRWLIVREPEEVPVGLTSLRASLEETARRASQPVTVSCVGSLWIEGQVAVEVTAAVKQALDNAVNHAHAKHITVFAEMETDSVTVSVRDDGVGFDFDENRLKARGKAGILKSMKGRVEDLGGSMSISSSPDGTEVEFRIPLRSDK